MKTPSDSPVERHPFEPFLPEHAKVLFLGSFPPQPKRWSMDFYYPNWINDFWRICGLLFFGERAWFERPGEKKFDKGRIISFCREKGFAMYDTATEIRRLMDNASDKFLEVVTPTDLSALLTKIPECRAIVTTGQKATETLCETFGCPAPPLGGSVPVRFPSSVSGNLFAPALSEPALSASALSDPVAAPAESKEAAPGSRMLQFWRMPSTSRAYPSPLEKKAAAYRVLFRELDLL